MVSRETVMRPRSGARAGSRLLLVGRKTSRPLAPLRICVEAHFAVASGPVGLEPFQRGFKRQFSSLEERGRLLKRVRAWLGIWPVKVIEQRLEIRARERWQFVMRRGREFFCHSCLECRERNSSPAGA